MTDFIHIHASGRFSKSPESLKESLDSFKDLKASIITGTEAYRAENRAQTVEEWAKAAGWGSNTSPKGHPFSDETYLAWDETVWKKVYAERHVTVSGKDLFRMGGGAIVTAQYATLVVLESLATGQRVLFGVTHTPSGVNGGDTWRDKTPGRHVTWIRSVHGMSRRANALAKKYKCTAQVLAADWNVNLNRPHWRTILKVMCPQRTLANLKGNTHGGSRIDGTLLKGKIESKKSRVLTTDKAGMDASDHHPYIETLVLTA